MSSRCQTIVTVLALVATAGVPGDAAAQTPLLPAAAATFTLEQALQYAEDHYPTVRAALEQVNASTEDVAAARTAYLPRLDAVWQSNLATTNNVFGQLLPQSVIPSLSGPVLPASSSQGVWSSATGALATWEPFDFGLRRSIVTGADAAVTRARANEALTRLDVQAAVGAAFLNLAAAQQAIAAAQADFDRRDVLLRSVQTLVDNQLRPGADASRAGAERAAAQTRLLQARQTVTLARTTLARLLGGVSGAIAVDAAGLLDRLPPAGVPPGAAATHPLALLHQAAIDVAHAQQQVLADTDLPRVYLESSVFARGTGATPDGRLSTSLDGLRLDRVNWAAGVQVVFPNVFDFANLHARKAAAAATTRAETALYEEAVLTVNAQQQSAAAIVETARAVAANTPVQLAAARQSEAQARARYDAGLATLNELAEAQSLLAQADAQDQAARLDVWRALLSQAVAQGSLTPFQTLVHP
jgi:outer membrane protein TolC